MVGSLRRQAVESAATAVAETADDSYDGHVSEGLVTLEKARVVKYAPGRRPLDTPKG
jgi:hypothetical protein